MNTNTLLVGLVALVVGLGGGYFMGNNSDGDEMANESMMHGAMGDMMEGLSGKTGDEFDKAFLAEMIVHHEGAVEMAQAALADAKHQELKDMAQAIISAQTTEIKQMQEWQKNWYTVE